MWVVGSLVVQLVVHGLGVCGCVTMGLAPRPPVGVVVTAPAFGTRPMTGGKGDCFVEKEQLGVVIRRPLGRAATLELQRARDPGLCLMAADDVAGAPGFVVDGCGRCRGRARLRAADPGSASTLRDLPRR